MAVDVFTEQNSAFLKWLAGAGAVISPGICIADFRAQGRGRGIVATREISEDEVLFAIPRGAVLSPESATHSGLLSGHKSLENEEGEPDPWLSLILVLVNEHLLGSDSHWKPYLDLLPTTFDTPIFWSAAELSELQASSLVAKIGKLEADLQFRERLLPLFASLPNSDRIQNDTEALHICHRMASTIMAYAFDIEPSSSAQAAAVDEEGYVSETELESLPKGMVPLADLLNADGTRNNARLFYEDDQLIMKSICLIANGDEIFNDYGELPRSDLLRRYGYVSDNYKQWDIVEIGLKNIIVPVTKQVASLNDTTIEDRLEYLEESEMLDEAYAITRPQPIARNEPVSNDWARLLSQLPAELLVLVQTLLLPESSYEEYKRRVKLPKPISISSLNDIPAASLLELARLLLAIVQRTSAQYDSSLIEDYQLWSANHERGILTRTRMALQVRVGEKEVLADAEKYLLQILGGYDGGFVGGSNVVAGFDEGERQNKRQRLR